MVAIIKKRSRSREAIMHRKEIRRQSGYTHNNQIANYDLWYKSALSFHEAAKILYENESFSDAHFSSVHFFYNSAISIELIIKAILSKKAIKVPMHHKLRKLSDLTLISLDEDQLLILGYWEEAICWLGRYPAPKTQAEWDNFQDNIFEQMVIRTRHSNTHNICINTNRDPSMENYIKIWKAYLDVFHNV